MIYLEQAKLSQLCLNIVVADGDYLICMQYGIRDMVDWFNAYWISSLSKQVASEIQENLEIYANGIVKIFYQLNKKIRILVKNYNDQNDEKIHYRGFNISTPYNINDLSKLNNNLPDGKVGLLNDEYQDISYLFHKIISVVEEASFILKSTIAKSDALCDKEIELIEKDINFYERKFVNSMEELFRIQYNKQNFK